MASKSRLADAWAKLERAKRHVDSLRVGVGRFADGQSHPLEIRRHFDPKRSAIVYTAWPGIPDDAGLMVGDAVSNFRSSINYVAWQLAIDYLGREPDDAEARNIQFPILDRSKEHSWPSHPHRKLMRADAADIAENFQPFHVEPTPPPELFSALRILEILSNHDKHRTVQVAAIGAHTVRFTIPDESTLRDCRFTGPGQDAFLLHEAKPLRDGNEIMLFYVVPTGSDPDVDLNAQLAGKAVFGPSNWDLIPTLDVIGAACTDILSELEPVLKPRS
jgi:hypothetical protein